jgi:hypothetical protein
VSFRDGRSGCPDCLVLVHGQRFKRLSKDPVGPASAKALGKIHPAPRTIPSSPRRRSQAWLAVPAAALVGSGMLLAQLGSMHAEPPQAPAPAPTLTAAQKIGQKMDRPGRPPCDGYWVGGPYSEITPPVTPPNNPWVPKCSPTGTDY